MRAAAMAAVLCFVGAADAGLIERRLRVAHRRWAVRHAHRQRVARLDHHQRFHRPGQQLLGTLRGIAIHRFGGQHEERRLARAVVCYRRGWDLSPHFPIREQHRRLDGISKRGSAGCFFPAESRPHPFRAALRGASWLTQLIKVPEKPRSEPWLLFSQVSDENLFPGPVDNLPFRGRLE